MLQMPVTTVPVRYLAVRCQERTHARLRVRYGVLVGANMFVIVISPLRRVPVVLSVGQQQMQTAYHVPAAALVVSVGMDPLVAEMLQIQTQRVEIDQNAAPGEANRRLLLLCAKLIEANESLEVLSDLRVENLSLSGVSKI